MNEQLFWVFDYFDWEYNETFEKQKTKSWKNIYDENSKMIMLLADAVVMNNYQLKFDYSECYSDDYKKIVNTIDKMANYFKTEAIKRDMKLEEFHALVWKGNKTDKDFLKFLKRSMYNILESIIA